MEVWVPIEGYESAYEVSNLGNVRSIQRLVRHWRGGLKTTVARVLKPRLVRGYCHVTLQQDGRITQAQVHRLVARAFVSNPLSKRFVNHIDGNKQRNGSDNLEWVTTSENNKHAFSTGLRSAKGERQSSSKLTEADVLLIRERLSLGESCASISKDFPVTDRAISRIKRRVVWSHI